MLLVVKSTQGRDRVKLRGAKCHEAWVTEGKRGEALGRLQVVRVQYVLALGSLAD